MPKPGPKNTGGPALKRAKGSRISGTMGDVLTVQTPEWVLSLRREARVYLSSTTYGPAPYVDHRMDPLLEGIRDAADECQHGNLPPAACTCW